MKDYSLNEEERKSFVLNYDKLSESSISVNFADGKIYFIPNTEGNENKLESKMIEQASNCDGKRSKIRISNIINILLVIVVITLVSIKAYNINVNGFTFIEKLILTLFTSLMVNIPMFTSIIINNNLLKDIKKNKFFVENQEVINKGLNNTNVLANSGVKIKQTENNKTITINDIDYNYSFNDLKTIVDNANREEYFEFDTFPEERPKIRRRKR